MGFRDVFHDYRTRGYDCRAVSFMRVGEYSLSKHKRFEYECFSGVFSEWCDDWATTVFSLAASGGKYTVPVARIRSRERHQGEMEGDMLFVWTPPDLLKTNIRYLEDFERLVKVSYDYHQEVDEVTHMASEIGMLRGHFIDTEKKRKMLYAAMTRESRLQTEADRRLISAHFGGDSRRTFSQLLDLFSKLQVKWDLSYPHWKIWQAELDEKWGVDAQTDSPLKNFERIVKYMQIKESEIKAMRGKQKGADSALFAEINRTGENKMYTDMDCRKTVDYYRSQGFEIRNIASLKVGEYSQETNKPFIYESFTAVVSGLSELDKKRAFSIADAFGYYLVPIVELDSAHPSDKSGSRDSVLAWIPTDFLKTFVDYLKDFEKQVKESYDYLQEAEGVAHLTTDIEMVRGYIEHFELCRVELRAAMIGSPADECPLLMSHFRGDSKDTYVSLVSLMHKLTTQWDLSIPHWNLWQDALNQGWHVDQYTASPLMNFQRMVSEMQRKEAAEKNLRPARHY